MHYVWIAFYILLLLLFLVGSIYVLVQNRCPYGDDTLEYYGVKVLYRSYALTSHQSASILNLYFHHRH